MQGAEYLCKGEPHEGPATVVRNQSFNGRCLNTLVIHIFHVLLSRLRLRRTRLKCIEHRKGSSAFSPRIKHPAETQGIVK